MKDAFQCMLAATEIPEISQIKFPLLGSFKYDGFRALILNGKVMSRKMIEIPNLFVQKWAKEHEKELEGLDGELVVGSPFGEGVFNRCQNALTREDGEPDFTYYVFECPSVAHLPAVDRYEEIRNRVQSIARAKIVEQRVLKSEEDLFKMSEEALLAGYEGLILKGMQSLYKFGRSTLREGILLKWKEFVDSECVVLGVKQATKNTNTLKTDNLGNAKRSTSKEGKIPKQMVGSFIVRDIHSGVEFSCSTGSLKEGELEALWAKRDELTGKVFTYKYQKVGVLNKPRFSNFKGWRYPLDI